MPLTVDFTVSQAAGLPSELTLTDTSTGSDAAVTQRRIYIQTDTGSFLVESGTSTEYENWALPLATAITLDLLDKDRAVQITVQWLNVSNAILYSKTAQFGLTLYNEEFDYGLTQML